MRTVEEAFHIATGKYAPGLEPVTPLFDTPLERARHEAAATAFLIFSKGWRAAIACYQQELKERAAEQEEIGASLKVCPDCLAKLPMGPVSSDSEIKCLQCGGEFLGVYDEEGDEWYWA